MTTTVERKYMQGISWMIYRYCYGMSCTDCCESFGFECNFDGFDTLLTDANVEVNILFFENPGETFIFNDTTFAPFSQGNHPYVNYDTFIVHGHLNHGKPECDAAPPTGNDARLCQCNNCPGGWIRAGRICYYNASESGSQSAGTQYCANLHPKATLPFFADQSEFDDFDAIFREPKLAWESADENYMWIGEDDLIDEGSFVHTSPTGGQCINGYMQFGPNEPDDPGGVQNCISLQFTAPIGEGLINIDSDCSLNLAFRCQIHLDPYCIESSTSTTSFDEGASTTGDASTTTSTVSTSTSSSTFVFLETTLISEETFFMSDGLPADNTESMMLPIYNFDPVLTLCQDQSVCGTGGTCRVSNATEYCECESGFHGIKCDAATNECAYHPCYGTATCVDRHLGYSCVCEPGFAGDWCETNIDDCINNSCQNGERCIDSVNSFTCLTETEIATSKKQILDDITTSILKSTLQLNQATGNAEGKAPNMTVETVRATAREMATYILANETLEMRRSLGYTLEETILHCSYAGKSCTWQEQYHPQFGNCFSFNNVEEATRLHTKRAGLDNGFFVTVDARIDTYIGLVDSVGFKAVLHSPGTQPFPDFDGLTVTIGYENQYAIAYTDVISIAPPYGDCLSNNRSVTDFFYEQNYTELACEMSYRQRKCVKNCGCSNPKWAKPEGISACSLQSKGCVDDVEYIDVSDEMQSECKKACRHEVFTVSSTKTEKLRSRTGYCGGNKTHCAGSTSGIGHLHIYYNVMHYAKISEAPSYTVTNVFSDMGGQMGLTTGMSVISLIELVTALAFFLTSKLKM